MVDPGIPAEHAESVVAACGLVVAALSRLGRPSWALLELAAAVQHEHRPAALAEARRQAQRSGCAAMVGYAIEACRSLVRSADGLRDHPDLEGLLVALDGSVVAALLADRLDHELAAVLTGPQRALTSLLGAATTAVPTTAPPTADARPGILPRPRRRAETVTRGG